MAEVETQPDVLMSPAERACQMVILAIRGFEAGLDRNDEVAMGFAGGEAGILRIEGIGYHAPDILSFSGRDETGQRMQLIQHVSQLSVVLRAVAKPEPARPARRIGFQLVPDAGWLGGDAGDASA